MLHARRIASIIKMICWVFSGVQILQVCMSWLWHSKVCTKQIGNKFFRSWYKWVWTIVNIWLWLLLKYRECKWMMRWRRVRGLWYITLDLSLCAVLLDKSSGDGRPNYLARRDGDAERLAESRDQGGKSQGPVGLIWVQRVPGRRHTCKNIDGISD